MGKTKEI